MTRRLDRSQFENEVRRKHAGWKHLDATIATLGEALFYAGIQVKGFAQDHERSTSRPLVSYFLDVLGNEPAFEMATETCPMHDFLPPSRKFDEKMDGCRFRDDAVSTIMSRGPDDIPAGSGEHVISVDREHYFYPVNREENRGLSWVIDDPKVDVMFRLFSAYPDRVAAIFSNENLAKEKRVVKRLASEIESGIEKSSSDKRTRAILRGIGVMMGFAPGLFEDEFAKTSSAAFAKEVVKNVALAPSQKKSRWEDTSIWATKDFVERMRRFDNPVIGDAAAELVNEDGRNLSGINRCDVSMEIMGGMIKASNAGYDQAKKYFDASCQHGQP